MTISRQLQDKVRRTGFDIRVTVPSVGRCMFHRTRMQVDGYGIPQEVHQELLPENRCAKCTQIQDVVSS